MKRPGASPWPSGTVKGSQASEGLGVTRIAHAMRPNSPKSLQERA